MITRRLPTGRISSTSQLDIWHPARYLPSTSIRPDMAVSGFNFSRLSRVNTSARIYSLRGSITRKSAESSVDRGFGIIRVIIRQSVLSPSYDGRCPRHSAARKTEPVAKTRPLAVAVRRAVSNAAAVVPAIRMVTEELILLTIATNSSGV